MPKYINNKKGSNLILVIVFLMLFMVMVVAVSSVISFGVNSGVVQRDYTQAYYAAKTVNLGIADALSVQNNEFEFLKDCKNKFESLIKYTYIGKIDNENQYRENNITFPIVYATTMGNTPINSDLIVENKLTIIFDDFDHTFSSENHGESSVSIKELDYYDVLITIKIYTKATYKGQVYSLESEHVKKAPGGSDSKPVEWKDAKDFDDNNDGIIDGDVNGSIKVTNDLTIYNGNNSKDVSIIGDIYSKGGPDITIESESKEGVVVTGDIYADSDGAKIKTFTHNNAYVKLNDIYSYGILDILMENKGDVIVNDIYSNNNVILNVSNNSNIKINNLKTNGMVEIITHQSNNGSITIENLCCSTLKVDGRIINLNDYFNRSYTNSIINIKNISNNCPNIKTIIDDKINKIENGGEESDWNSEYN